MTGLMSASLSHLNRADGSVTFSHNGYTVLGAVNGPIEAQRRDELPQEAAVDVIVRPASGVGGLRERSLESIVTSTLRHVVLTQNHPRTLIQVTLQITTTPENDSASSQLAQGNSNLPILPCLLQASVFALLSASIPLSTTFTSTILVADPTGKVIMSPSAHDLDQATSRHVLAFSPKGDLLVAESEGNFSLGTWEDVFDCGRAICCAPKGPGADDDDGMKMDTGDEETMEGVLRRVMEEQTARDQRWKGEVR
ncbi:MAG: exosome non-catalytic core subunit rrp46 [Sclerophora amabilis]|nr:MAG: exosome non-catalytic core subunit rrp46 [Sclerophora amabilis]